MSLRNTKIFISAIALSFAVFFLTACNSGDYAKIDVTPLPYDANFGVLKVRNNYEVGVTDFVDVIHAECEAHNIKTELVGETHENKPGEYVLSYDAKRSWDMGVYMAVATIWIHKGETLMAKGRWELDNGGSYDFSKFDETDKKMKTFYDALFKNYPRKKPAAQK